MVYAVDERTQPGRVSEEELAPLVTDARAGDIEAFEAIVRMLQGPVRSFSRRILRDTQLGDDAAQEIFLRMWKGLRRFEPGGRFLAWTFTVARNTCIELWRKESRAPVPTQDLPVETDDPTGRALVRRAVADAIDALGEPRRTTFLLRETGLSYEEIGSVLECPVGTVRSRLHAARRELAQRLSTLEER